MWKNSFLSNMIIIAYLGGHVFNLDLCKKKIQKKYIYIDECMCV